MQIDIKTLRILEETFGDFQVRITKWDENQLTFRFGYWRECDVELMRNILKENHVQGYMTENWIEDDDCGYQYYYVLKNFQH